MAMSDATKMVLCFHEKLLEKEKDLRARYSNALNSEYESDRKWATKYDTMADVVTEIRESLMEAIDEVFP